MPSLHLRDGSPLRPSTGQSKKGRGATLTSGRLFARCFDAAGQIRENQQGNLLASLTTMLWNAPAKGWNAGAPMDDANLNRRMTLRFGPGVAFAQLDVVGFDGVNELEALRLYGLPEAAPAILNGTPTLPNSGQRHFAVETEVDLPNLAPGAEHLFDISVPGARPGDLCSASLATSSRFVLMAGHVWTNNTVRVVARNVSGFSVDLPTATLAVEARKRGRVTGVRTLPRSLAAAFRPAALGVPSVAMNLYI